MAFRTVDFPAPLGPITAVIPAPHSNETPWTTATPSNSQRSPETASLLIGRFSAREGGLRNGRGFAHGGRPLPEQSPRPLWQQPAGPQPQEGENQGADHDPLQRVDQTGVANLGQEASQLEEQDR